MIIFKESEVIAVNPTKYKKLVQDSRLLYKEEHLEFTLLTTLSNNNFKQTGIKDKIILISSNGNNDINNRYSDNKELQFPLKLKDIIITDGAGNGNN